mgnify:CR=1 FL=1
MPYSYSSFKKEIIDLVLQNFLNTKSRLLDVGSGSGKYGKIFQGKYNYVIDAVEVFKPYIVKYKLHENYNNVYNIDLRNFDWPKGKYSLVIMGDVFEHLTVEDAQKFLNKSEKLDANVIIQLPFKLTQGKIQNNTFERHLQPDLTENIMKTRYPKLKHLGTKTEKTSGFEGMGLYYLETTTKLKKNEFKSRKLF